MPLLAVGSQVLAIGSQSLELPDPPVGATLVAADATYTGYMGDASWGGSTWGSLSDTTAPGGETITAIYWEPTIGFESMILMIAGNGKDAWFTGRKIVVDGIEYSFTSTQSYGARTLGWFHPSNLFTVGNSYVIGFA